MITLTEKQQELAIKTVARLIFGLLAIKYI